MTEPLTSLQRETLAKLRRQLTAAQDHRVMANGAAQILTEAIMALRRELNE